MKCQCCGADAGLNGFCSDCMFQQLASERCGALVSFGLNEVAEMTVDSFCYVCGKEGWCIDGLCPDCHMEEFFRPGRAFAATFGSLESLSKIEQSPEQSLQTLDETLDHDQVDDDTLS